MKQVYREYLLRSSGAHLWNSVCDGSCYPSRLFSERDDNPEWMQTGTEDMGVGCMVTGQLVVYKSVLRDRWEVKSHQWELERRDEEVGVCVKWVKLNDMEVWKYSDETWKDKNKILFFSLQWIHSIWKWKLCAAENMPCFQKHPFCLLK